jgi:ParB family chromosome partitioning protein
MLGKGLESLIPKSNPGQGQGLDGSANATGNNNNASRDSGSFQPRPSFVPPAQSVQPVIHFTNPPQERSRSVEQRVEPRPVEPRPVENSRLQYQPQPLQQRQPATQPSFQPQQQPSQSQPTQRQPQQSHPMAAQSAPAQPQKRDDLAQESIYHIEIEKITPNPDQPRRHFDQDALQELASSIREFGFLQPLVVSKVEKETATGIAVEYQIIAGERRFMAAKMLGLPRVPAIVRNVNLEREKLELGVIENIQRENLNPIEMARAFQRLQEEFRMTQREIAAKLGKSREVVANAVRLLDLPEYVQRALEEGDISESNARLLIAIEDPAAQKTLLEDIIQNKLTTRDVKERVQRVLFTTGVARGGAGIGSGITGGAGLPGAPRRGRPPLHATHLAPEVKALQDELSTSLGAPVEISKNANNGKITITFFSEEELKNILEKLKNDGGERF